MKTVIITGVSTGIGESIAHYLNMKGFQVIGTVRSEKDYEQYENSNIKVYQMDVTDFVSMEDVVYKIKKEYNNIFGLINNAGIAVAGPAELLDIDEYRKQFEVNFFGLIKITQSILPLMKADSRIINMSSVSGIRSTPFLSPYCASKHALEGFSKALRIEMKARNIHVSTVRPGYVKTPIWDKAKELDVSMYDNSIYRESMSILQKLSLKMGSKGCEPIKVAEAVLNILHSKRPKSSYRVTRTYFQEHFIPTYFPKSLLESITTKILKIGNQ